MTELFLKVLDLSLSASWVILAVLAARLVLKKAPKWVLCALWALVAVRLLCPVSLESSWSLIPEVTLSSDSHISAQEPAPEETALSAAPSAQAPHQGESPELEGRAYGEILSSEGEVLVTKELKEPKDGPDWYQLCAVLWAAGTVILLLYAAVSYWRIREKVRASVDIGNGVFICDYIDTPFILGILKPKVYLSSAMDPADAAHVLAHERAHLKRKDHWWKPLGFLLLSVHWFNPLMWAAYILLCRDIELACDERVVKTMDLPEKKAYSEALLNCSVPRRMIAACPLAFGEVGVKQRVKNVLNYKKPAFWVLLASLLVIAIVAVCFLTDPKVPVLSDFYTGSRSDVTCIDLMNTKGHACLDMPADMEAVWDLLDELEYDPQPHDSEEEWDNLNDQGFLYCELEFNIGKQTQTLYFYRDFSSVCCEDEQGTLNHYTVKTPELAETFFSTYISCIRRTEVSVEPFATWEEPYAWMQNATTEAFLGARVNRTIEISDNSISISSYAISLVRLEEFLAVLKTVPASALSGPETIGEGGTDHITVIHSNDPNMVISIQDGANDQGVAIRYYQEAGAEKLEIVMVEGAESFASNYHSYITPVLKWDIQCQELLDYMKGLLDYNLSVSMFSGYWMDWADDYITVTNGEAQIKQRRLNDWTYEIVEPTEDCESFGIRVRPPEEEEGWLYFSWWGDNFVPGEEIWQEGISLFGTHFSYYQSYLEDTQNTGILSYTRMHCIHGDYVILNEGADAWMETYSAELNFINIATSLECLPQLTQTEISDAVAWTLGDMLYYDWDAIARWFGNGTLTLFDPQFYGGFLFVGCEENGNYHILVFRQQEDGSYEYLQALAPTEQTISNYDTATLPMVQYQTADSELQLCLITDPAITGLECGSGLQNYIPITSYPALVLLDQSCWKNQSGVYFELRYDALPPSVAINHYKGNNLKFEEAAYEQQYIYSNVVSYFDGTNKPGRYSLDSEEIQKLIDILTSLPQEAITRKYLATEEQDLQVDLTLFADSGQRFAWGDTRLEFVYSDDAVTLCVSTSTETKSYSENHQYYYTIESEELRDFLLALCDASRGTADLLAASTADPVEYRHGDAAIKLYPMLGLEYEIVEYTDDETPFGIRVRPLSSNKGWVFYSYWPKGFTAEGNQEEYTFSEGARMGTDEHGSWRYEYRTAYQKGKDRWSYEQITNVDGDYVILNENADKWLSEWSSYLIQQVRQDSFADGVTLDASADRDDGTLTVANGSGSIQFQTKPGWECEIVEYTDDETPFGIRIRPVIYDEGWIFLSYWPKGFTSEETIQSFSVTSMLAVHNGKLLDASFRAAYTAEEMARDKQYRVWTYAQLMGLPASGDYVLLNEGAERWFKDYEQYLFPSISWDSETNGIAAAMID